MNTDMISAMYQKLGVDKDVLDFGTAVEATLKNRFSEIDTVTEYQNDKEIILCKRLGKHQHLQDALKARVEETFEYVTQ